ncbi:MAG: isochorismatase family protein [Acidimicrobiia bacterium]|nr:isochorismatase family protein [Acidimicrobiia bacterium]MDH3471434.1 isochorismatase family protein [Acidimicrobiia bacterium]
MAQYDSQTALVVVDVQNDFADPEGGLYVNDGAAVVPVINEEIAKAKAAGAQVVYTADWHPESTPHFEKDGGIWPVHCVGDTWGSEFHPDLVVDGPVVRKGTKGEDGYSGFFMKDPESEVTMPTELASMLRDWGVKRVVVAGLATDYCVKATALDGIAEGFDVALMTAAVRSVDLAEGDGAKALDEVSAAGGKLV